MFLPLEGSFPEKDFENLKNFLLSEKTESNSLQDNLLVSKCCKSTYTTSKSPTKTFFSCLCDKCQKTCDLIRKRKTK